MSLLTKPYSLGINQSSDVHNYEKKRISVNKTTFSLSQIFYLDFLGITLSSIFFKYHYN